MSQVTLARRTLGGGALWVFAVGASSPLTVLVGGVVSTYALTGVVGVPLAFLVIMVVVCLLAVGYVAMARHVVHSAPFYAQMARVNPAVGVAAGLVALLGYNTIQISLYGLVSVTLAGLAGGPWWGWAAAVWVVVALLGRLRGAANAKILGTLLAVELAVICLFDLAAFAHPADGVVSLAPLAPPSLMVGGLSGALAFSMAAFVGAEAPPAFGEEARSGRVVERATFTGLVFLGLFYTLAAWAYAVAVGPGRVADAARDPDLGSPFAVLGAAYGNGVIVLATMLLVTSVIAAMVAFHGTVARYVFALAREGVLAGALARVSSGAAGGAPLGGSLVQSVVAAVVVAAFAQSGADPMGVLFTWLSTIGAVCVLVLLVASSVAARAFFAAGRGGHEPVLVRQVIPVLGSVSGALATVFMVSNLSSLLNTPPGSRWPWLVPAVVAATAVAGLGWGLYLRHARPRVYARLGQGAPNALTVQDQRLAALKV